MNVTTPGGNGQTPWIGAADTVLELVDGGEDGEVMPIQPLLVGARGVDVILALDATDDVGDFTNGSSLIVCLSFPYSPS